MIVVKTPNQALQPTAGRSDVWLSDDFNVKFRSKACFRQRWLNLVSLDANARRCRHVIAVRSHRC